MTLADFWAQALRRLHHELSEQQFQLAIAPITVEEEHDKWVIYSKNQFTVNLLRSQYASKLAAIRAEIAPDAPELSYKVGVGKRYEMATTPLTLSGSLKAEKQTTADQNDPPLPILSIIDVDEKHSPNQKQAKSNQQPEKPPVKTRKTATAQDILAERLNNLRTKKNHAAEDTKSKPASTIEIAKTKEHADQRHIQTNLSPEYTFDTLVEGKSNHLAAAVAKSIAEKPSDSMYNPFFVYGSTGLGKTHLVQAIGNELLKFNPKARVRYMHADEYLKTFMATVRSKTWDTFKQQYLNYHLLIIDDIQFIQGKDRTMEEFFFLFEHFHSRNQQIILTCDQLPSSLENMEQRLISRFSWGMTIKIDPPELEMRINILERKAKAVGMTLRKEAALFIAQHIKQNVRELEGALNRVVARCRFEKRTMIDVRLATDALQDIIASHYKPITVELIMKTVADYYHIRISDLLGKKRTRNIARPRQMAMLITKELTNMSLPAIGEVFGGRDHTTVIHAIKTMNKLRIDESQFDQDYEQLLLLIKN